MLWRIAMLSYRNVQHSECCDMIACIVTADLGRECQVVIIIMIGNLQRAFGDSTRFATLQESTHIQVNGYTEPQSALQLKENMQRSSTHVQVNGI